MTVLNLRESVFHFSLLWIGATMGPETKDVNLADDAIFTV
ncbi:UNVERIFIED_ORG: hypothetical protein ABIB52_000517 [Arthrobacter sp. UYCu721]